MISHVFFLACELTISHISIRTGSPKWWIYCYHVSRYENFPASCVCLNSREDRSTSDGHRYSGLPAGVRIGLSRIIAHVFCKLHNRPHMFVVQPLNRIGVDGRDMLGLSKIETWGRSDTLLSPDQRWRRGGKNSISGRRCVILAIRRIEFAPTQGLSRSRSLGQKLVRLLLCPPECNCIVSLAGQGLA